MFVRHFSLSVRTQLIKPPSKVLVSRFYLISCYPVIFKFMSCIYFNGEDCKVLGSVCPFTTKQQRKSCEICKTQDSYEQDDYDLSVYEENDDY